MGVGDSSTLQGPGDPALTPARSRGSEFCKLLAGFCLVSFAGLGAWQLYTSHHIAQQKELLSEATVLAQRMAWASNLLLSEDQNAIASLKESKSRMGLLLITLHHGGRLDGQSHAPILPALQGLAVELNKVWQPLENACTSVLEGEPVAHNDPRFKAIRVGLDQAALSLEKILDDHRRNSPKDVNELTTMEDLLFSLQAISQVLSLTEPGARPLVTGIEPDKIITTLSLSQAVIDRLMNGHRDSNIKPAPDFERARLLGVRNDLASALRSADSVSALLPKLSANIEASRQVGKQSEALRIQLSLTRKKLADPLETARLLGIALAAILTLMLRQMALYFQKQSELKHAEQVRASALAQQPSAAQIAAQRAMPDRLSDRQDAHAANGSAGRELAGHTGLGPDLLDRVEQKEAPEQNQVAMRGIIAALQQLAQNTAQAVEQSNQTVQAQAETLKANAQLVLQLAHAFHNISTETTEVARTALKSQKQLGEHHHAASEAVGHWEDVRGQLMKTASKLRRAGEASRELSARIEQLPADERTAITELLVQTREALRDAVTGLAESSVQVNYGQKQAQDISEVLGDTQQQWIELLNRIEVCAGTAAAHTQTALGVSKNLSRAATPGVKLLQPGQ